MATRLVDLILTIAECERKVEIVRQVLAEQVLFEPYTSFKRLDQKRKGHISYPELKEFLDDNQITYTDIDFLVQKIDKDQDGQISYTDFGHYILPRSTYLKQLANMRESYYIEPNMLLPYEVEWSMARVFSQEILNHQLILSVQNSMVSQAEFDLGSLFKLVNSGKSWDENSVKVFLARHEKSLSNDELQSFFGVADANKDGLIDYRDFLKLFKEQLLSQEPALSQEQFATPEKKAALSNYELSTAAKSPQGEWQAAVNAFIVAVKQLIEFQEEIAGLRRELAGRSDFSVESLFFEMDSEQKGELTRQEFRDAVEGYGLELEEWSAQETLTFAEFQKALMGGALEQREDYEEVSQKSLLLFKKLLLTLVDSEDAWHDQKKQIAGNEQAIFNAIDREQKGYLTLDSFKTLFEKNQIYVTVDELVGVMKRFDKDMDGVVVLEEFEQELSLLEGQ